jgi:tetratricopeptide (TPR) repeat protein
VLITQGDDAAFVLDYLQRVAGQRPDIELYNRVGRGTDLLQWREHALSAREQNQLRLQRERALLQQGRQVYYLVPRQAPLANWDFAPAGLVYHLRPKGEQAVAIGTEIEMANGLADGFARDAWVRKIQSNYWFMAGEQRLWAGDIDEANTAFEQAATVAYDSRSTRFNVALKLYRNNELDRAVEHAEAAIAIDPWQAEPYQLLAHIFRKQQRLAEARELLKKAGSLKRTP